MTIFEYRMAGTIFGTELAMRIACKKLRPWIFYNFIVFG